MNGVFMKKLLLSISLIGFFVSGLQGSVENLPKEYIPEIVVACSFLEQYIDGYYKIYFSIEEKIAKIEHSPWSTTTSFHEIYDHGYTVKAIIFPITSKKATIIISKDFFVDTLLSEFEANYIAFFLQNHCNALLEKRKHELTELQLIDKKEPKIVEIDKQLKQ